jgi:hypothetical protein
VRGGGEVDGDPPDTTAAFPSKHSPKQIAEFVFEL